MHAFIKPPPFTQCDICLEEFPQIEMLCARGSQNKLTVQEAREGCLHFSCKECMEQYVRSGIAARRYPLTCPCGQGCDRWIMYGDLLKLLKDHPEDLKVREGPDHTPSILALRLRHAPCAADMFKRSATLLRSCN